MNEKEIKKQVMICWAPIGIQYRTNDLDEWFLLNHKHALWENTHETQHQSTTFDEKDVVVFFFSFSLITEAT